MAKQNRNTLKNYFKKGALPSQEQFGDLIDSSLNMVDEGFTGTPPNGVHITTQGDHDSLLTFFRGKNPEHPKWALGFQGEADRLHLFPATKGDTPAAAFTVTPDGQVGVKQDNPAWQLDVNGVVGAKGRIGVHLPDEATVRADGGWKAITPMLTGCNAFEVIAGVGKPNQGRYALMHAIALNVHNPAGILFNFLNWKKRISYSHAYYLARRDMLKLHWEGSSDGYRLMIKSNSDYQDDVRIRYFITQLWFDPKMTGEAAKIWL